MLWSSVQQVTVIPGFRIDVNHVQLPQAVCIAQDGAPYEKVLRIQEVSSKTRWAYLCCKVQVSAIQCACELVSTVGPVTGQPQNVVVQWQARPLHPW